MASFCYHCVVPLCGVDALDNDFTALLLPGVLWRWGLCEGCGLHCFDAAGRRVCGWDERVGQDPSISPCMSCSATDYASAAGVPELFSHVPGQIDARDEAGYRTHGQIGDVCFGCSDPDAGVWVPVNECPIAWPVFLAEDRAMRFEHGFIEPF